MAILAPRQDPRAAQLAAAVLLERLPIELGRMRISPEEVCDGKGRVAAIPTYSLSRAALHERRLDRAWRSGWRYIWEHPTLTHGGMLSVSLPRTGPARIVSYSWSSAAPRLARRVDEVVGSRADEPVRSWLRLLHLVPLRMEALWIVQRGPDTLHGLEPGLDGPAFLDEAVARLSARERGGARYRVETPQDRPSKKV